VVVSRRRRSAGSPGTSRARSTTRREWFFLVRTVTFEPSSSEWTDTESATIRGHRWWSIDELRASTETVFPEDLPDRLERLLGR